MVRDFIALLFWGHHFGTAVFGQTAVPKRPAAAASGYLTLVGKGHAGGEEGEKERGGLRSSYLAP